MDGQYKIHYILYLFGQDGKYTLSVNIWLLLIYNESDYISETTIKFYLQVSREKGKGSSNGYVYSTKCSGDCPQSCGLWKIWNGTTWEEDATLTVQCTGH